MTDQSDWKDKAQTIAKTTWQEGGKLANKLKKDFVEYREQNKQRQAEQAAQSPDTGTSFNLNPGRHLIPRERPEGTYVFEQTPNKVVFKFQAIRAGWVAMPNVFGGITLMVILFSAFFATVAPNLKGDEAMAIVMICGFFGGLTLLFHAIAYPSVRVTATQNEVRFGKMLLHREYYGGPRMGSQNKPASGPHTRIWIRYGQWGEDTPYMLKSYKAIMILTWINQMIDSTAQTEASSPTETGEREQVFG